MKKKSVYFSIILLVVSLSIFIFGIDYVYADSLEYKDTSNLKQQPYKVAGLFDGWGEKFKPKNPLEPTVNLDGWNAIYKKEGNSFDTAQNVIVGIVQTVGYIVSVLMITIIGIKYIYTSPEGKADVKKQLVPLLIGALLLFSGTVLVTAISTWSNRILN